jgi:hypothetical protein
MTEFTFWMMVFCCLANILVAFLVGRRRLAHAAIILLFLVVFGAMFLNTGNPPAAPGSESVRVVYLGWTDERIVVELARRWPSGRTVLVVNPAARAFCASKWPSADVQELSAPGGDADGVTVEAALRDLRQRLPGLTTDTTVYLIAPRSSSPAACRQQGVEMVRDNPWLRDRLHVIQPSDLGIKWPSLMVEAPLAVSPDVAEGLVGLIGRDLPHDASTIDMRAYGPKQGPAYAADTELSVISVKCEGTNRLGLAGTDIKPSAPTLNLQGKLPMPKEGKSLTFDAALTNSFGETLSWARATTTSRIQPIGILVPQARKGVTSALQALLEDLRLEHEDLVIDLGPSADPKESAKRLQRWRVLLCDHPLSKEEGETLQRVIRELPATPVILFAGSGSDDGTLPGGWQVMMKPATRVTPEPCRMVLVGSDTSGSMNDACGAGQMRKHELAVELAKRLARGFEQRRWNRLVLPLVGPDGQSKFNTTEVTVENYAKPGLHPAWELDAMLLSALRMVKAGHPVSDCVFVYDPQDVSDDAQLPQPARDAAQELHNLGVRLWLVAAGAHPHEYDLGPLVYGRTVKSLSGCGNDANRLLAEVEQTVLEEMFPHLRVEAAAEGPGLTKSGYDRLKQYVETNAKSLRLLNGLTRFDDRAKHPHKSTTLWLRHWDDRRKDVVSPLLVHGVLDLGAGQTGNYVHLTLDLTAERAKIPSETSVVRNSLAGLIVRVVAALSDEMQQPGIYWLPNGAGGLAFYSADHRPLQLQRDPAFDRQTLKGVGLGLRTVEGFGAGLADAQPDVRRLELPDLTPEHLDRAQPSAVRFVVEDQRPEVGRLGLTLTLTAPPPLPLPGDARSVGGAEQAAANAANNPDKSELRIPGWLVPWAFGACWALLAWVVLRRL